jgi:hypothetical protein
MNTTNHAALTSVPIYRASFPLKPKMFYRIAILTTQKVPDASV